MFMRKQREDVIQPAADLEITHSLYMPIYIVRTKFDRSIIIILRVHCVLTRSPQEIL